MVDRVRLCSRAAQSGYWPHCLEALGAHSLSKPSGWLGSASGGGLIWRTSTSTISAKRL
jgi:hypothetical protein